MPIPVVSYAEPYQSRMMRNEKPIHYALSYKVNGILFAVHNEHERFQSEKQYGDAIEGYLRLYGIPYEREVVLPKSFESELPGRNRVDFIIDGKIILEVKAKRVLERADYYQTKRYLIALGKKLALLINFRNRYLRPKRILNSLAKE